MYILRFAEGIEIKTLKFVDYNSAEYVIKQLEEEGKDYVIISKKNFDFTQLDSLLDLSILESTDLIKK